MSNRRPYNDGPFIGRCVADAHITACCTECGKRLTGKIIWLEFDQRSNTYTKDKVPPEYSQGGFPFGADCAKRYY